MTSYVYYLAPLMGAIGLLYTIWKFFWVSKQDAGTERMQEISTYIAEGAMAFLKAEWKILFYFGIIVALLLATWDTANRSRVCLLQSRLWWVLSLVHWPDILVCGLLPKPMFAQLMQQEHLSPKH